MPKTPESFEGAVAESIREWLHRYIPAMAESLGPLPDTVEPTSREKLDRWDLRTDQVQPGPMTDQLADEALRMCIEEYQQQGKPIPDGDTLTKLVAAKVNHVLLPYRQEVYGRGQPRPTERVREAERYARMASKRQQPTIETVEPQSSAALPSPDMAAQGSTRPGAMPDVAQGGVI